MAKRVPMVIICGLLILITGCSLGKGEYNKSKNVVSLSTFYSSDNAISVCYNSKMWEPREVEGLGKGIALNGKDLNSSIGFLVCKEYSEIMTENEYVNMLVEEYKKHEIKGSTTVTKIKIDDREFSVVQTKSLQGKNVVNYNILMVMNGTSQYEFVFQISEINYDKYKDSAMDVFKTLKILKKSNDSVSNETELAKGIEDLDKIAGIDKKSVMDNVSKDGIELISSWGNKKDDGSIDIRLVLNKDGSYKRYKQYPDETSILVGTWSYDGKRILKLKTTKAIDNSKDIMSTIEPNQEYEIYYFKDNTMKIRNVRSLNETVYSKK